MLDFTPNKNSARLVLEKKNKRKLKINLKWKKPKEVNKKIENIRNRVKNKK